MMFGKIKFRKVLIRRFGMKTRWMKMLGIYLTEKKRCI